MSQVEFLQRLIRCKSITPVNNGAIELIAAELQAIGFKCHVLTFSGDGEAEVTNLYAEYGTGPKNLCFGGHSDVVPAGNLNGWSIDPFEGVVSNGHVYGRGAVDMKGAISAFIYAIKDYIATHHDSTRYKLSILISGNEEGDPINGMVKLLRWLKEHNHTIDACIVGEPTNSDDITRTIKVGRRGSLSFDLTIHGVQGHVAYPHNAHNAITDLVRVLALLKTIELDKGSELFQPSNLEITNVEVGNPVRNVIPSIARASINIRFNNLHDRDSLLALIKSKIETITTKYELQVFDGSESFYNHDQSLTELVSKAVREVESMEPILSTSGGTSDARLIKNICPVVEYGLNNQTAHKVDEYTTIRELENLQKVYYRIIQNYFS
jgi:succinyl-diaminopimelate desuccinylase